MNIQILSEKNIKDLNQSRLCCWGMVRGNVEELFQGYPLVNQVELIVDDNVKKQGIATLQGKEITVISSDEFSNMSIEDFSVIITSDYHEEVLKKIEQNPKFALKEERIYRFVNSQESIDLQYRELYKDALLEDIIIFRSGPYRQDYVKGADFWDNSRALFDYMLEAGYNQKYKLVWLVKNPEEFVRYKEYENVEFLSFDWEDSENQELRDKYYRALCLAKCIFTSDAYGFAKNARKDQLRIQLWHGCGFKTRNNFIDCELRYDYMTVVSELYAELYADNFGLRKDQLVITGYPKHDWLFKPYAGNLAEVLQITPSSKYVFWLPTFRIADDNISSLNTYEINPETGLPIVANEQQMLELNELLKKNDITMVIKLHPLQKTELVKDFQFSNIAIFNHMDLLDRGLALNRLLASADAMISDYSSAATDYLVLDRPMAFTLDDLEEYVDSRGFIFDNIRDWLPGKEVFTFEDFCEFIREIGANQDTTKEKRGKAAEKMLKYKDDQNSKRVLDAFGITK